jgi:hypothetical protein
VAVYEMSHLVILLRSARQMSQGDQREPGKLCVASHAMGSFCRAATNKQISVQAPAFSPSFTLWTSSDGRSVTLKPAGSHQVANPGTGRSKEPFVGVTSNLVDPTDSCDKIPPMLANASAGGIRTFLRTRRSGLCFGLRRGGIDGLLVELGPE